ITGVAASLLCACMFGGCGAWNDMWGLPDKDAVPQGPAPKCDVNLPSCSGGMVLPVNGELITVNEVISSQLEELRPMAEKGDYLDFRRNARPLIDQGISNRISNIVLHQKAKKEMKEGIDEQLDKAADTEIRQFLAGFNGNYADAEKAIKKMGMDWKSFREYQKKLILVQYFLSEELKDKRPITYSEMHQYYENAKDEQFHTAAMIQFRLIDIVPARFKPDANDPNLTREKAAQRLADTVMEKLKAGEDFGALAKQYSYDPVRAPLGGLWTPVSVGSLAAPYDVLETAAAKLEPGQVAGPIEAKDRIFILKLESKRAESYEPFEKVQHTVEISIKLQRRKDAVDKMVNKLMAQADVGDRNVFLELCLQKAYQQVKQN
ncbi:MAG: peptidyl-prolyl cis-trans isomerase, partial [Sedimentisphaerales bacterium]|nr:peptidyl-prolyl cis-trans isomerase [Sedimentisphaerales bacterium]